MLLSKIPYKPLNVFNETVRQSLFYVNLQFNNFQSQLKMAVKANRLACTDAAEHRWVCQVLRSNLVEASQQTQTSDKAQNFTGYEIVQGDIMNS